MTAYYNEIDPFAATWLRELIKAGHIADGEVDTRSIADVMPSDLAGFTQCHFFAGIGVWSYALRQAGWSDDRPVWTGSCPCQPFSTAGVGKGFADERHLWPAFFHLISQRKPSTIFGEQVAKKRGLRWFDLVRSDLECSGYACGGVVTCAAGFSAPHIRERLYWCATDISCERSPWTHEHGKSASERSNVKTWREFAGIHATHGWASWVSQSGAGPLVDGATARVGRVRGYGNGLNVEQAVPFIEAFMEVHNG